MNILLCVCVCVYFSVLVTSNGNQKITMLKNNTVCVIELRFSRSYWEPMIIWICRHWSTCKCNGIIVLWYVSAIWSIWQIHWNVRIAYISCTSRHHVNNPDGSEFIGEKCKLYLEKMCEIFFDDISINTALSSFNMAGTPKTYNQTDLR